MAFATSLQDAMTTEDGEMVPISLDNVNKALEAVTHTVFPYCALETQRLWMNRKMFKPSELTTRQMAASINWLNNALLFSTGTESSKFTEMEIIGLLEWSLPAPWSAKFDLDGYIPTLHSKTRLIEACEAIERNEHVLETFKSKEETSHSNKTVKRISAKASKKPGEKQKQNGSKKHYCSEHGQNPTHSTADCWTLQNRAKPAGQVSKDKHTFSNKHLRNEINLLAKQSYKKKILYMYASVIKQGQSKLGKKSAKRKRLISLKAIAKTRCLSMSSLREPIHTYIVITKIIYCFYR